MDKKITNKINLKGKTIKTKEPVVKTKAMVKHKIIAKSATEKKSNLVAKTVVQENVKGITKSQVIKRKKKISVKSIIKKVFVSLLLALSLVIIIGFAVGCDAYIVNGWSMEPVVEYRSLIVDYKKAPEDIKLGDTITYSRTGSGFVTHQLIRVEIEDGENTVVIAEFREKVNGDVPEEWVTGDAYVKNTWLDDNVVAWYSGVTFDEDTLFTTKSTFYTETPLPMDGSLEQEDLFITYDQITGIVLLSIPKVGDIALFIQNNTLMIVIAIVMLFLVYNMIRDDIERHNKLKASQNINEDNIDDNIKKIDKK